MNRLMTWLKAYTQRNSASIAAEDDNNADSSFGWFGNDKADSSIFVTGSLTTKKSENQRSDLAIEVNENSLLDAENDEGFDPYNSGRFNAKSK